MAPAAAAWWGGSLTSAQYTASYSYDTLGRLTSAPLGSYTYGDPTHLDAATAVGTSYTASYDAPADMACRSPSNTVTCFGSPTGAAMTYDVERRLAMWPVARGVWAFRRRGVPVREASP